MIVIRLYRPRDLPACTGVFVQVFSEPPWQDRWPSLGKAQAYVHGLAEMPRFRGYLAWEVNQRTGAERIVAFALGYIHHWWDGDEYELKEFGVLPEMQRQGVGSRLLEHMQADLQDRCAAMVLLTLRHSQAQRFYQRHGFRVVPEMAFMAKELDKDGLND